MASLLTGITVPVCQGIYPLLRGGGGVRVLSQSSSSSGNGRHLGSTIFGVSHVCAR